MLINFWYILRILIYSKQELNQKQSCDKERTENPEFGSELNILNPYKGCLSNPCKS